MIVSRFQLVYILPKKFQFYYYKLPLSSPAIRTSNTKLFSIRVNTLWLIAGTVMLKVFLPRIMGLDTIYTTMVMDLYPRKTRKSIFNMKHAQACNVIEWAFGILKSRWAILRSHSHYPNRHQNRILMACAFLHNFVK